jgi:hypothetical protein
MKLLEKKDFPYRTHFAKKKFKLDNNLNESKINIFNEYRKKTLKEYKTDVLNFTPPIGFWYGFRYSWLDFLNKNKKTTSSESIKYTGYVYEITIKKDFFTTIENKDTNKILQIKNKEDLLKFHKKYYAKGVDLLSQDIDWEKVRKIYGGIEIKYNPFNNSKINDTPMWYIFFDIPSGCIWNNDILEKIDINLIK